MKTWLAIETATEACSVALFDGKRVWQDLIVAPNRHSELLLPMIDGLLAAAGMRLAHIDAFAVGVGPGGFTAVRLGVSTVQGLAIAMERPIYPISSLQALAASVPERPVLVALDARRGEVYAAAFVPDAAATPQLLGAEQVCRPELLGWPPAEGEWLGLGTGWSVYADRWPQVSCWRADCYPAAAQILALARRQAADGLVGIPPEAVEPRYLRPSQAEEARQR
ncbi:tRNA (adenosine(37)-N6)-threonylcarbamoyltransferase complex dimerization subunit type 1 TsaB [Candidatus Igneacidithiobacillus taiwanensis]|uniref:tRNA (adenosine(37)-N6)-threonylcarbamoyltransferase complex dimerization subunit type 1 TsaB n=1 Tax=Candidatus Igneacidithiobacillus taiwanensis TaxID=1945924 RepID=UPI00289AAA55|nr:tRNA (adenosine(37)-N6)-threonylcarbamoyltransferase complex dimerization subunit type 1 TsaB [Candidatus Igneacidithiobacillus taiwanensis]MCE5359733.1 tRNA (adenosine(37)-N6)-threonylcarbamoyltransferase complex dimerization subunit type 1 TsaB [Acidithiobacillus sp.]